MTDRKLTLFEIHLDDASFTANASATETTDRTGSGSVGESEGDSESADGDGDAGSTGRCPGRRAARALLAVGVLAGVAVAVSRLLGGVDEDLAGLAALDEE